MKKRFADALKSSSAPILMAIQKGVESATLTKYRDPKLGIEVVLNTFEAPFSPFTGKTLTRVVESSSTANCEEFTEFNVLATCPECGVKYTTTAELAKAIGDAEFFCPCCGASITPPNNSDVVNQSAADSGTTYQDKWDAANVQKANNPKKPPVESTEELPDTASCAEVRAETGDTGKAEDSDNPNSNQQETGSEVVTSSGADGNSKDYVSENLQGLEDVTKLTPKTDDSINNGPVSTSPGNLPLEEELVKVGDFQNENAEAGDPDDTESDLNTVNEDQVFPDADNTEQKYQEKESNTVDAENEVTSDDTPETAAADNAEPVTAEASTDSSDDSPVDSSSDTPDASSGDSPAEPQPEETAAVGETPAPEDSPATEVEEAAAPVDPDPEDSEEGDDEESEETGDPEESEEPPKKACAAETVTPPQEVTTVKANMLDLHGLDVAKAAVVHASNTRYWVLNDGKIVASLDYNLSSDAVKGIFNDSLPRAFAKVLSETGLTDEVKAAFGFTPYTIDIDIPKLAETQVQEKATALETEYTEKAQELNDLFQQCVGIAAVATNKNLFDSSNVLKAGFYQELSALHIPHPEKIIDRVFKANGEEYLRNILEQAKDIMSKSDDARETMATLVAKAAFQTAETDEDTEAQATADSFINDLEETAGALREQSRVEDPVSLVKASAVRRQAKPRSHDYASLLKGLSRL